MSRRRRLAILAILFVSALAYWLLRPNAQGVIPQSDVTKLEIELYPWVDELSKPIAGENATLEDQRKIAAVIASLKPAVPNKDHKCAPRGQIRFIKSDGSIETIDFLPGHDEAHYEFRMKGENYRIPRIEFIRVLLELGIRLPLEC